MTQYPRDRTDLSRRLDSFFDLLISFVRYMGFTIYHDAIWVQPSQRPFLFLIVYFVLVKDGMEIFRWNGHWGGWMAYDGVIFGCHHIGISLLNADLYVYCLRSSLRAVDLNVSHDIGIHCIYTHDWLALRSLVRAFSRALTRGNHRTDSYSSESDD